MADVVKKVDFAIPPYERRQTFTQADVSAGSVVLVNDSLGRPARHITIKGGASGSGFKFNVYQTIYSLRENDPTLMYTEGMPNLAQGHTIMTLDSGTTSISANEVYNQDFPIYDIYVVSGTVFDISVW